MKKRKTKRKNSKSKSKSGDGTAYFGKLRVTKINLNYTVAAPTTSMPYSCHVVGTGTYQFC